MSMKIDNNNLYLQPETYNFTKNPTLKNELNRKLCFMTHKSTKYEKKICRLQCANELSVVQFSDNCIIQKTFQKNIYNKKLIQHQIYMMFTVD